MERRLSAILAADLVGFTRLVRSDEIGTIVGLRQHKDELIEDCIQRHAGRIFKHTGDGFLAEFSSVVNALNCALSIQGGMRIRNAGIAAEKRLEFRIGVNIGDVLVEGEDILGDGVNVASRVEAMAKAGGIAVTSTVRDHIDNRIDVLFDEGEEVVLKNIEHPVRIFHVRDSVPTLGQAMPRAAESADLPSILVLPFVNMSGDVEQDYFSDGITEDIITDLSKLRGSRLSLATRASCTKARPLISRKLAAASGSGPS